MPTQWNLETLEQLRHVMDADADNAITSVYQSKSNDLLRNTLVKIASNDSTALKEYFSELDHSQDLYDLINRELSYKFTDEDVAMFNRTYTIWQENGIRYIYILFFRALPFTYAAEKPANVLRMTKLIEDQATRRIFETAQFVFDVMDSNWWTPEKRGVITSVKIRLMHAAMRYMLLNNQGGEKWEAGQWGMPISQEDMIATNQVFSLEFFKGMKMLTDQLSDDDQKAWFHTWKTIGRIMGIQQDLLLPTVPEAWGLQTSIYGHLFKDTHESGIGLAKALVGAMQQFLLPEKLTLFMMQRMMYDEGFPDIFNKLLGPTYAATYPDIFSKTSTTVNNTLDKKINNQFFEELKKFSDAVADHREKELATAPVNNSGDPNANKSLIDYQLDEFKNIFGEVDHPPLLKRIEKDIEEIKDEIVDTVTTIIDDIEHKEKEIVARVDKDVEELIKRAMNAVSAVIIELLSKYFRQGKMAGFRIDANLKDHWKIK